MVTKRRLPDWWPVAFACIPLLGFWLTGLFDLDEGFYGAVTAEMNRRGEWLIPYYNGQPWFEKPILLYWVAKPSMILFGDVFGPRLPSFLAAIGLYSLVFWFLRRRVSLVSAQHSVLILGSSLLVVALGRMMMTDMLLTLSMSASFLFFYESLVGDPRWKVVAGACLGISVLAKGPVGCVLLVPLVAYTLIRFPELRRRAKGWWFLSVVAFLVAVSCWYLPAYLTSGNLFVQKFLVEQNLQRFAGGDTAHRLPGIGDLFLYVPILFVLMIPWSLFIPKSWPKRDSDTLMKYLAAWALIVFVFFSMSGTKLPNYILPAFVPLAILVGIYRSRRASSSFTLPVVLCVIISVIANFGSIYYYNKGLPNQHSEIHSLTRWVKTQGGDVATYQMSRREEGQGTGTANPMETSHPSVVMILDRVILQTDSLDELLSQTLPLWVLTRTGRIGEKEAVTIRQNGKSIEEVKSTSHYVVYKLTEASKH